jgi:hypothetical protein
MIARFVPFTHSDTWLVVNHMKGAMRRAIGFAGLILRWPTHVRTQNHLHSATDNHHVILLDQVVVVHVVGDEWESTVA